MFHHHNDTNSVHRTKGTKANRSVFVCSVTSGRFGSSRCNNSNNPYKKEAFLVCNHIMTVRIVANADVRYNFRVRANRLFFACDVVGGRVGNTRCNNSNNPCKNSSSIDNISAGATGAPATALQQPAPSLFHNTKSEDNRDRCKFCKCVTARNHLETAEWQFAASQSMLQKHGFKEHFRCSSREAQRR